MQVQSNNALQYKEMFLGSVARLSPNLELGHVVKHLVFGGRHNKIAKEFRKLIFQINVALVVEDALRSSAFVELYQR